MQNDPRPLDPSSSKTLPGAQLRIADVLVDLRRGSMQSNEHKAHPWAVIHSTSINPSIEGQWQVFPSDLRALASKQALAIKTRAVIAEPGDIVLGRTGRNAFEKSLGIAQGEMLLSDWLWRLKLLPSYQQLALNRLSSPFGRNWLQSRQAGSHTKFIPRQAVLDFPLH